MLTLKCQVPGRVEAPFSDDGYIDKPRLEVCTVCQALYWRTFSMCHKESSLQSLSDSLRHCFITLKQESSPTTSRVPEAVVRPTTESQVTQATVMIKSQILPVFIELCVPTTGISKLTLEVIKYWVKLVLLPNSSKSLTSSESQRR